MAKTKSMARKKNRTYTVFVVEFTEDYENEIFSMDYEADDDEDEAEACAHALEIAYHGCVDN